MHSRGLTVLGTKQSRAHDSFGGIHIFLTESRSESQGIADVVESECGSVGGKAVGWMQVDAQKIADGVVVLAAIQPACRDAPCLRLNQTVLAGKLAFEPTGNRRDRLRGRPRQTGRRHLSHLELGDNFFPDVAILFESFRGL